MENKSYLNLKEASRYLNLNERTMKSVLEKNKNQLKYQKLTGKYLINKASLDDLLASNSFVYQLQVFTIQIFLEGDLIMIIIYFAI